MSALLTLSADTTTAGNPNAFAYDTFAGYHFHNPILLTEGLHARGDNPNPVIIAGKFIEEGKKCLGWVGDALISLVLRKQWYLGLQTRNQANKGWYGEMVKNKTLGRAGFLLDLDKCCFLNEGETLMEVMSKSRAACTVEALLGAIWVDNGEDLGEVERIMRRLGSEGPAEGRALAVQLRFLAVLVVLRADCKN